MSDQQPQTHTTCPRFVPAQWPDQSGYEDTGPSYPTHPKTTSNLPQAQSPYISSLSPFVAPTPHPSFVPLAAPSIMPSTMPHIPSFQYNRTMPSPGDWSAPRFDGHPPSLKHFFDEMDYLGNTYGLSSTEEIQHTLCYLDFYKYETWRTRRSAQGFDWNVFKAEITALYPGVDEDRKYTVVDLEILVDKQACKAMQSCYQFGDYYHWFVTISDWLLAQHEISIQDQNKLFINGFDQTFQDWLTSRLYVKNPNHPLYCPWPMDDIAESAQFFLASNSAANESNHYSYPSYNSQSQFNTFTSVPPAPACKTFDMSLLKQFMVSDVFISKLADKLELGNIGGHLPNNTTLPTISHSWPPRPEGCVGCLDCSHYYQSCPIITDYISQGLCKQDDIKCCHTGQLILAI